MGTSETFHITGLIHSGRDSVIRGSKAKLGMGGPLGLIFTLCLIDSVVIGSCKKNVAKCIYINFKLLQVGALELLYHIFVCVCVKIETSTTQSPE